MREPLPPLADRPLPHATAAERQVLGGVLRYPGLLADLVPVLSAQDFWTDFHQRIWSAALALFERGLNADPAAVAQELLARGQLEDGSAAAYLAELWDLAGTGANVPYYAGIVRDHALRRHLIHACTELMHDAHDPIGPADELLERAQARLFSLASGSCQSGSVSLEDALRDAYNRIGDRLRPDAPRRGVPHGVPDLDRLLPRLVDSELVILAARPSAGKTALGLSLAVHAAFQRLPVYFASLEQSRLELAERVLSREAGVDGQRLRTGELTESDLQRLRAARDFLLDPAGRSCEIDDAPTQGVLRIAAGARRMQARRGLRLVVVDYLQLIEPDNRRAPRHEQVAGISRRLKQLARELRVPVVALAQLNRTSEDRPDGRPRLADLRESGGLEADADTVILIHRPRGQEMPHGQTLLELIVAKQRNGPVGECSIVFEPGLMRFAPSAPSEPPPFPQED
jgi:replicative DNA helicase